MGKANQRGSTSPPRGAAAVTHRVSRMRRNAMRLWGLLVLGVLLAGCATHDACFWRARAVSQGAPRLYTPFEAEQDCRAWENLSRGGAQ